MIHCRVDVNVLRLLGRRKESMRVNSETDVHGLHNFGIIKMALGAFEEISFID